MTAVAPRMLDGTDALTGAAAQVRARLQGDTAVDVLAAATTPSRRWTARRILRWSLVLGLTALFGVEVVLLTPYLERAADSLTEPDPLWLTLALVAEGMSMGAFARVQRRMLSAAGQRVGLRSMLGLTYAANALSVTFPGGTALSTGYVFKRLRSFGATVPAAGFTVVASGVLSLVGFAVLATLVGVSAGGDLLSSLLVLAGAIAVGGLICALRHRNLTAFIHRVVPRVLRRVNRVLHRPPEAGVDAVQRFTDDLTAIHPRQRDWLIGLGLATLNWGADLLCLIACCKAIGADHASIVLVMVAYVAGMSASSVSLLPGGFGIVDAAMIFALTSGGMSTVAATAGVVLYRLISFLLVVAVGWLTWLGTWAVERRHAATAELADAENADAPRPDESGPGPVLVS